MVPEQTLAHWDDINTVVTYGQCTRDLRPLVRSLVLGRSLSIGTSSGLLGRVCSAGVLGVGGIARVLLPSLP